MFVRVKLINLTAKNELDMAQNIFLICLQASTFYNALLKISEKWNTFAENCSNISNILSSSIPLSKLFNKIFEIPNTFKAVFDYVADLNKSDKCTCFLQSPFWQSKIQHMENSLVLPYFFYFDDFGNNNSLGSHKKATLWFLRETSILTS
jgi:hypothetical protein